MKAIKILESEEGMLLDIHHRPGLRVHGTIVTLCADTKGAHEIGVFMSPSATKICRLYEINRTDLRNHGTTDNNVLRTRRSIDQQVKQAIENFPNGDPSSGIRGACPYNESRFFHIGENLIMDSMHDIPEGVGPFILKLCLNEWNTNRKDYGLTAEFINQRHSLWSI